MTAKAATKTVSDKQRAASRANGLKSRGPKTTEGKERSRTNAMRHGLRAEALAMPNEDPNLIAERGKVWNEYYRPESPAAQHLVNECVRATLMADRVSRAHAEAVAAQVRTAVFDRENAEDDRVDELVAGLKEDPSWAVRRLKRFGRGCRWLVGRWERLGELLDRHGRWDAVDRDEAIRLLGHRPGRPKESPEAYLVFLYNDAGLIEPDDPTPHWLFEPAYVPESLYLRFGPSDRPDPAFSLDALKEMVADNLAPLQALADDYESLIDTPDRIAAADRALVLRDDRQARLFLRYQTESRTAFHRHYSALLKTLDRDALNDSPNEPETVADTSPNEPETPAADVSPNEPKAGPSAATGGSPNEPETRVKVEGGRSSAVEPVASFGEPASSPNEPESPGVHGHRDEVAA